MTFRITLHRGLITVMARCEKMHYVIDLKQTRGFKNVTLRAAKKIVGVAVYWVE